MASVSRQGRKALLGKKLGMSQIFEKDGRWIPVTVLQVGPCTVLQVKNEETDGYEAVQLGFDDKKRAKQPQKGLLDKIGVTPKRFVREVPFVDPKDVLDSSKVASGDDAGSDDADGGGADGGGVSPGAVLGVKVFEGISKVDVRGVSKGRGFAGVVKRHGFSTGDHSHGGKSVRLVGSTGMHTDPGRVQKGKKMPGHFGNVNCKTQNLEVVRLEEERNLLLVKGAVPGPTGGYLYIEESLGS
jgi:large subunit ribosomal protein L3